jgi:DNA-binding transcriptional LysR family regulator
MRAEGNIRHHLKSGRLVPVLSQWDTPDADIYAVYPKRLQRSVRVRAFVRP